MNQTVAVIIAVAATITLFVFVGTFVFFQFWSRISGRAQVGVEKARIQTNAKVAITQAEQERLWRIDEAKRYSFNENLQSVNESKNTTMMPLMAAPAMMPLMAAPAA